MALEVVLKDSSSGTPAEIDANGAIVTVTPGYSATGVSQFGGSAAAPAMFSENDPGTKTGARYVISPETDDDYRLRVSQDTVLDTETFNTTAQNTGKFLYTTSTATASWSTAGMTLNSGSSTSSGAAVYVITRRAFPVLGTAQLYAETELAFSMTPQTNVTVDFGLVAGFSGTGFPPTDGVFFRLNSAGLLGVINNNGSEVTTSVFDFSYVAGETHQYIVAVHEREVEFWIDDVLYGSLATPAANGQPTMSAALCWGIREGFSGAAGGALQVVVKDYNVTVGGLQTADSLGSIGNRLYGSHQGLTGGTMGSLASYANSTTPAGAAGSNTAALVTGLGGQAHINAQVAGTTDNIITSYQVPAVNLTNGTAPRTLRLNGVKISAANLGAAVATTATTIAWSLAFGHTAVSLATSEAATTKAPRREALGVQFWPVGAVIGATPQNGDLYMTFDSPIYVNPGEFIATVAKFIVGTATASQTIYCHVTFDYGWE